MDLQFRWTESDYVAAQCAWILHRPWLIIRGYWYSLLIICMALVGIVLKPERWKIDFLFILVATGVAMPSLLALRWRWQFRKNFSADAEILATVDEQGVKFASQGNEKIRLWAGFSQIYESRRVVIFEKDESDFILLPKRVMSSGQIVELKRLADSAPYCKVKLAAPLA